MVPVATRAPNSSRTSSVAPGDPVSDRDGGDRGLQPWPEGADRNAGGQLGARARAAVGAAQAVEPVLAQQSRDRRQLRHLVARRLGQLLTLRLAEAVSAATALGPVLDHLVDRHDRLKRTTVTDVAGLRALAAPGRGRPLPLRRPRRILARWG